MEERLDLYTDYLLASFGQTSATGLSRLVNGAVSHDQVTRLLANANFSSKDLWQAVKPLVRTHETETACLIFDDVLIEKPYMDENDLICWHYDPAAGRTVKGINSLNAFYHTALSPPEVPLRIPVGYALIKKDVRFCVLATQQEKRKSLFPKNELMRTMMTQAIANQLKFKYVLADSWFASADHMRFVKKKNKYFIFDLKTNRTIA